MAGDKIACHTCAVSLLGVIQFLAVVPQNYFERQARIENEDENAHLAGKCIRTRYRKHGKQEKCPAIAQQAAILDDGLAFSLIIAGLVAAAFEIAVFGHRMFVRL
jgi:hypothetical protein